MVKATNDMLILCFLVRMSLYCFYHIYIRENYNDVLILHAFVKIRHGSVVINFVSCNNIQLLYRKTSIGFMQIVA